jgi:hypothetical protein
MNDSGVYAELPPWIGLVQITDDNVMNFIGGNVDVVFVLDPGYNRDIGYYTRCRLVDSKNMSLIISKDMKDVAIPWKKVAWCSLRGQGTGETVCRAVKMVREYVLVMHSVTNGNKAEIAVAPLDIGRPVLSSHVLAQLRTMSSTKCEFDKAKALEV